MKKIIRNRAFKALICVIVALSLGAVIAAYTHNNSTPLSSATSTVLHPLQKLSSYLSYKFSNFNDSFKSSKTLAEENSKLKEQIEEYQNKIIDYNNMKKKLGTYEDFLGVKQENPDFKFQNANIISNDFENPFASFTLNKGTTSGVKINDPVIYGKNLVGVVTSVAPTSCTVYTLSNPKMNVSVYETYTGEIGYVTGLGKTEGRVYCKLNRVPPFHPAELFALRETAVSTLRILSSARWSSLRVPRRTAHRMPQSDPLWILKSFPKCLLSQSLRVRAL